MYRAETVWLKNMEELKNVVQSSVKHPLEQCQTPSN